MGNEMDREGDEMVPGFVYAKWTDVPKMDPAEIAPGVEVILLMGQRRFVAEVVKKGRVLIDVSVDGRLLPERLRLDRQFDQRTNITWRTVEQDRFYRAAAEADSFLRDRGIEINRFRAKKWASEVKRMELARFVWNADGAGA